MTDGPKNAPEEAGLELDRAGTRFVSPETEAAYEAWVFADAVDSRRSGILVSAVFWVGVALLVLVLGPPGAGWVIAGSSAVLAIIAWMYVCNARRLRGWTTVAMLVGYSASGLVGLALAKFYLHSDWLVLAAAVWACFFQLGGSRERPALVLVAVATYGVPAAANFVALHRAGELDAVLLTFSLWVLGSAYGVAGMMAVVADRARRRTYRQERIIAAQRATIARQQARLEEELAHQVAERSRELGAVLARSDVTLDVRRFAPGERFDARYRIVAPLGAGGMGAVYEVERLTDGAHLALKAVVGEVSSAGAARFAREAEIGARLRHPNLVSIVDVGVSGGVPFLVMELVKGGSLESRRGSFGDVAVARPILQQIAEGLLALHDAGVVHRDLKPGNVLLAGDAGAPVAKISDFGISRFGALDDAASIDPAAPTAASPSPRSGLVTGTGVVLGTPLYMAPEAARGGRALEPSADVFALGILAYEMLTGRAPFAVPAMMLAMSGQPIPVPAPIERPMVPPALAALVLECLSEDPGRRPRVRRVRDVLAA